MFDYDCYRGRVMKKVIFCIFLMHSAFSCAQSWYVPTFISGKISTRDIKRNVISFAYKSTSAVKNVGRSLLRFVIRHPRIAVGTAAIATASMTPARSVALHYGSQGLRISVNSFGVLLRRLFQRLFMQDMHETVQANGRILQGHTTQLGALQGSVKTIGNTTNANNTMLNDHGKKIVHIETTVNELSGTTKEIRNAGIKLTTDVQELKGNVEAFSQQMNVNHSELLEQLTGLQNQQVGLQSTLNEQSTEIKNFKGLLEQIQSIMQSKIEENKQEMILQFKSIKDDNDLNFTAMMQIFEKVHSDLSAFAGRPSSPLKIPKSPTETIPPASNKRGFFSRKKSTSDLHRSSSFNPLSKSIDENENSK